MPTVDRTARAIHRANLAVTCVYALVAATLAPRFQQWPRALASFPRVPNDDSFVSRMMRYHPAVIWLAIPALLLIWNGAALAIGDSVPPFEKYRRRAIAWLSWPITLILVGMSALFDAGWRAVERNDPSIFYRAITRGVPALIPILLILGGVAGWNVYREHRLKSG